MFSDANIKIPVLNYHRVLEPLPVTQQALPVEYRAAHNISVDQFKSHLTALAARNFQSVTARNYLAWVNGAPLRVGSDNHVLRENEHAFMAIFDDANRSDLRSAELMRPFGYTGVAAIMTQDDPTAVLGDKGPDALSPYIGNTEQGYLTWEEIRRLARDFDWEIASHSFNHVRLGDGIKKDFLPGGIAKPADWFRNTPAQLETEFAQSKLDIINHVFEGDPSRAPVAFVHPFHDLTRRSLVSASEHYPMVFGKAFSTNDAANPPQFIGKTSGLQNGELVRIEISKTTSISDFERMLDLAASDTPFAPPLFIHDTIPNVYVAMDGSVVATGTQHGESIRIESNSVSFANLSDGSAVATVNLNELRTNQYAQPVLIRRLDVHGGDGADQISAVSFGGSPITIRGGAGSDTISGSDAADVILGGAQPDVISGGGGNDVISGGGGNDILSGNAGHDHISGGAGNDRINGNGGRDYLDGGSGKDRLNGGAGRDTLHGGAGDDRLISNDSVIDEIFGGDGNDTATADPDDIVRNIESMA